jgi:hypothetical protein
LDEGAYRAEVKRRGLTPLKTSYEGATIHVDRDGLTVSIPDPDTMTPEQREAFIQLLSFTHPPD